MIRTYLHYESFRINEEKQKMSDFLSKPTESELEILQVLWQSGPSTVRFVHERLSEQSEREVGYTTTLKLMQIMVDKGLATRNTDNRVHIYEAAVSESATQQQLLDKFVESAFRGSAVKMVMQALGHHQASAKELEEIKALIESLENKRQQPE